VSTDAPAIFSGDDGEVVFVRRDVAETVTAARAYALEHEGANLSHMEVDEVEMLEVPEHFIAIRRDLGHEWSVVRPGTPGAVTYWRFRL
jgi:hypothetical protein